MPKANRQNMTWKRELISEINEMLDSLSPAQAVEILYELRTKDLVQLKHAIEEKIRDVKKESDSDV